MRKLSQNYYQILSHNKSSEIYLKNNEKKNQYNKYTLLEVIPEEFQCKNNNKI